MLLVLMGLYERLLRLANLANKEFKDILAQEPLVLTDRIRLFLRDDSFMDIRYPVDQDYSLRRKVDYYLPDQ